MKKTISIYNGSPRKNGNTAFVTEYILEKVRERTDTKVRLFHIVDYKIDTCYGCRKCMKLKHCTNQTDDFEFLFNTVRESDVSIWCVPVYWFAPPGIAKNFIDRTHAYFTCKPMLSNQKAYLLNIATDSGFETSEKVMKSWLQYYRADVKKNINIYATESNDIRNSKSKLEQIDSFVQEIINIL